MGDFSDLQRSIDAERAELDATLEELSNRMTARNLAGEATNRVADMGEDLATSVVDRLRHSGARPWAAAVAGLGLDLVLNRTSSKAPASGYRPTGLYNGPKAAEGDPNLETPVAGMPRHAYEPDTPMGEKVDEAARGAMEAAQARLAKMRRQAEEMRARIYEGTDELTEEARARVVAARERAIVAAEDAGEAASLAARRAVRQGNDYLKDNPMMIGGIALAVGAAVAGALWWNHAEDDDKEDDVITRAKVFDDADRIFEEEVARARAADRDVAGISYPADDIPDLVSDDSLSSENKPELAAADPLAVSPKP